MKAHELDYCITIVSEKGKKDVKLWMTSEEMSDREKRLRLIDMAIECLPEFMNREQNLDELMAAARPVAQAS